MSDVKSLAEWRALPLAPKKRGRKPGKEPIQPVYLRFGALIREMRARHALTQWDLADELGWPRAQVAALETGRVRVALHKLPDIARAFRVPLSDLMAELQSYLDQAEASPNPSAVQANPEPHRVKATDEP